MVKPFELNSQSGTYTVSGDLSSSQILAMAHELINGTHRADKPDPLTDPTHTKAFLANKLQYLDYEVFACVMLDTKHHVLGFVELFRGTINASAVYPREVLKEALRFNAAAIIFAHNHPSGDAEPSQADQTLTRRLVDALKLVDVRVLDHVVIGHGYSVSFAERGLL